MADRRGAMAGNKAGKPRGRRDAQARGQSIRRCEERRQPARIARRHNQKMLAVQDERQKADRSRRDQAIIAEGAIRAPPHIERLKRDTEPLGER